MMNMFNTDLKRSVSFDRTKSVSHNLRYHGIHKYDNACWDQVYAVSEITGFGGKDIEATLLMGNEN